MSLDERLAMALFDPKLGWNIVSAYAESDLEMPHLVIEHSIQRAFDWLCRDYYHAAIVEARALANPANQAQADLVRALLLCNDISIEDIAKLLKVPADVVYYFDQLMFNVRDRLDEPVYIHHVLHSPTGRAFSSETEKREAEDPDLVLMRTGYLHGATTVLRQAGLRVDALKLAAPEATVASLERRAIEDADTAMMAGDYEHPSVGFAKSLAVAAKREQPATSRESQLDRFSRMDLGKNLMQDVLHYCGGDIYKRQRAAAEAEKAIKNGSAAE
jgi:hypothetical protein